MVAKIARGRSEVTKDFGFAKLRESTGCAAQISHLAGMSSLEFGGKIHGQMHSQLPQYVGTKHNPPPEKSQCY